MPRHSTTSKTQRKQGIVITPVARARVNPPATPKGFPLTPHSSGKYCVYRNRRMYYYGRWYSKRKGEIVISPDGWREAWDEFRRDEPDLAQGREPVREEDGPTTIGKLCNEFLAAKTAQVESGELNARTLADYRTVTDCLVATFAPGRIVEELQPEDFAMLRNQIAKRYGPFRLANTITRIKSVFKFGFSNGLMEKPVRYGTFFDKPKNATLRRQLAKRGTRVFEADEVRLILKYLDGKEVTIGTDDEGEPIKVQGTRNPELRAMVLLGVNCGFGSADCSAMPIDALDLERAWIDFPRVKTAVNRHCPLWDETVSALREVIAIRPEPRREADANQVFISRKRRRFAREGANGCHIDGIAGAFSKVMKALGVHKPGRGFYALRHTHRTIADGALDQSACAAIMGHTDNSVASFYRHGISDDRLRAVVDHVRTWLFPSDAE